MQLIRANAFAMQGSERGAILQVRGDGAKQDASAGSAGDGDDVAQVGTEVPIYRRHLWRIGADLPVEKHLHAAPLIFLVCARRFPDKLAQPRGIESNAGPDDA